MALIDTDTIESPATAVAAANALIYACCQAGIFLTIESQPLLPLKMGNNAMVPSARLVLPAP
jgi:hypothetical protein